MTDLARVFVTFPTLGEAEWAHTEYMAGLLKCSFCGKSEKEVNKLVAGPGVYICDTCIELCNQVIAEASTPS